MKFLESLVSNGYIRRSCLLLNLSEMGEPVDDDSFPRSG